MKYRIIYSGSFGINGALVNYGLQITIVTIYCVTDMNLKVITDILYSQKTVEIEVNVIS